MRIRNDGFPYVQDAELGDKYTNQMTGQVAVLTRKRVNRKDGESYYIKYWKIIKGKGTSKIDNKKKRTRRNNKGLSKINTNRISQLMLIGLLGGLSGSSSMLRDQPRIFSSSRPATGQLGMIGNLTDAQVALARVRAKKSALEGQLDISRAMRDRLRAT